MHFATNVRTWHVACLSASWQSFMLAITPITRSSNSSRVSTFVLYTLLFLQQHKQKSNGVQYSGSEGQYRAPNPSSCTVKQLYHGKRSEKDTCTNTLFCLEWLILWPPRILTFPPGIPLYTYIYMCVCVCVCVSSKSKEYHVELATTSFHTLNS